MIHGRSPQDLVRILDWNQVPDLVRCCPLWHCVLTALRDLQLFEGSFQFQIVMGEFGIF